MKRHQSPRRLDCLKAILFCLLALPGINASAGGAEESAPAPSAARGERTEWMTGKYGLMVQWIAPGPAPEKGQRVYDLDQAVDAFSLNSFLADFDKTGASWLIFTVGQNTGFYASPNSALDGWAGPGHCSRRDLVKELAREIHARGKRFIAYLPSEVKAPTQLHEAFQWNPQDQGEFQRRYAAFIREYSERWGKDLDGWWLDGSRPGDDFPSRAYDWPLWLVAARAGNPAAAVAFNDGSFSMGITQPATVLQDYLSGEVEMLRDGQIRLGRKLDSPLHLPESRFVGQTACQWHALVPIDCAWFHVKVGPMDPPRYSDLELFSFVRNCLEKGGAVTLNAGIYQEGRLGAETAAQLSRLSRCLPPPR